jgi:hypothetical protein
VYSCISSLATGTVGDFSTRFVADRCLSDEAERLLDREYRDDHTALDVLDLATPGIVGDPSLASQPDQE